MAFMVLLESLSPLERAVFLLREVFSYDYATIASMVGRDEDACRQLFSRARKHLVDQRPRYQSTPEAHARLLSEFAQVLETGETGPLTELLVEDVTWVSDGGGKVYAARRPIVGREAVIRLLLRLMSLRPPGFEARIAEVNGLPALIFTIDLQPYGVLSIETDQAKIHTFRLILNPDKLARLQPRKPDDTE